MAHGDGKVARLALDLTTSLSVIISMLRWRPVSTSLGLMVHMAQSLVGKVLSSWAMCPPMADLAFDQVDLEAGLGQVERGLHAGDAAADDHHGADGLSFCIRSPIV